MVYMNQTMDLYHYYNYYYNYFVVITFKSVVKTIHNDTCPEMKHGNVNISLKERKYNLRLDAARNKVYLSFSLFRCCFPF